MHLGQRTSVYENLLHRPMYISRYSNVHLPRLHVKSGYEIPFAIRETTAMTVNDISEASKDNDKHGVP